MRFGLQLWSQSTDWPGFRDAALAAEAHGWDSVWTWDHVLAIFGPWEQPIFEGWSAMAALGPITSRIRLGLMVGANTFRNPGLTAKLATTLDHVSGGRAVLGIGGAWFEREHDAFGFDFGATVGERLDWLDESVMLMRRLLDGERFDYHGRFHHLEGAELAPSPRRGSPRLMIGSNGPRMLAATLPHVHAWNSWYEDFDNDPGALPTLLDQIDRACAAAGRDPTTLSKTVAVLVQFGGKALRRNPHNPIRGTAGELAEVLARFTPPGGGLALYFPGATRLSPVLRAFVEVARGVLGGKR